MENSVTITLARYHDLIDIERDFTEKVKAEVKNKETEWAKGENEIAQRYREYWQESSIRNSKFNSKILSLQESLMESSRATEKYKIKNEKLQLKLKYSAGIHFATAVILFLIYLFS